MWELLAEIAEAYDITIEEMEEMEEIEVSGDRVSAEAIKQYV